MLPSIAVLLSPSKICSSVTYLGRNTAIAKRYRCFNINTYSAGLVARRPGAQHILLTSRDDKAVNATSSYIRRAPVNLEKSKAPRAMSTTTSSSGGKPRILIFGTGAIGSCYAFVLSRAGCHITAICRSNYDAVASKGITIESTIWGDHTFRPDVVAKSIEDVASQEPQQRSKYDFIVVASKSFPGSKPTQASLLSSAVTEGHTAIALIQNGIAIEDEYSVAYPENPILSGVVYLPATQTSPGVVMHREGEALHVGTYPAEGVPSFHREAAERLADLITKGGATVEVYDDIQVERWEKLLLNGSWNPVCALTRCRDAEFLYSSSNAQSNSNRAVDSKDSLPISLIRSVMLEIALVAHASGYPQITRKKIDFQLARAEARTLDTAVEPSMLADALNGRGMEVEAIVGNCVRVADEKGLGEKIPLLRAIYILSRALDGSQWRS